MPILNSLLMKDNMLILYCKSWSFRKLGPFWKNIMRNTFYNRNMAQLFHIFFSTSSAKNVQHQGRASSDARALFMLGMKASAPSFPVTWLTSASRVCWEAGTPSIPSSQKLKMMWLYVVWCYAKTWNPKVMWLDDILDCLIFFIWQSVGSMLNFKGVSQRRGLQKRPMHPQILRFFILQLQNSRRLEAKLPTIW